MRTLFLVMFLFSFFTSCNRNEVNMKEVTVNDLRVMLNENKNIQLLDVRTPSETKNGIINNALQVDWYTQNFKSKALQVLSKNKPVYVYCRSGKRSAKAANLLVDQGFKVYNVIGGYQEWKKSDE